MSRLVTYRCSNCKRITTFQDNPAGFSTLGSCNITKNCTGELVAISNKRAKANPTTRSMQNDLVAWYPRRCLHQHTQPIARKVWAIQHNLDVQPLVIVYGDDGIQVNDYTVAYPDRSNVTITFANAASGSAHLIARTGQNDYDVAVVDIGSPDVAIDANGVLTIATLTPVSQPIVGTILFYHQITNQLVGSIPITFSFGQMIAGSSWADYSYSRFNGRRYNVRQVDVSAELTLIPDLAYFRFTLGTQFDTVFLLTDAPYAATDANPNSVAPYAFVESADGAVETKFGGGKLLVTSRFVEKVVAGIAKTV